MSDDSDLVRLFAEEPEPADSAAFADRVLTRIHARRRFALLVPTALLLVLLIASWTAAPALADAGVSVGATALLFANGIASFFNAPDGMTLAAALGASAIFWSWLYPRLAARGS